MADYQGQPGGYPQGQPGGYPQGQPGGYPQGQPGGYPQGGYQQGGYPQGQPGGGYPGSAPPGVAFQPPPQGGAPPPQGGAPPPGGPQAPGGPPPWQVADQDVSEDASGGPPPAPAFNTAQLPQFQGYGAPGEMGQFCPVAPPVQPSEPTAPPPHTQFESVGQLTEEECRDALLQFVSEHTCYGKGPAKNMEMTNFLASTALRYVIETYTEARTTGYQQEPFTGQMIDGPQNGTPPMPWDIAVHPDNHFQNQTKVVEVPHTASVQPCNVCFSYGFVRCHHCMGRGMRRCISCHGSGTQRKHDPDGGFRNEQCWSCHGSGRKRCISCHGRGMVTCHNCQGHRSLKVYMALTVNFINHVDDHIIEKSDMPDELVRNVQGNVVFQDTALYCSPISAYPVPDMAKGSVDLVEKHRTAFLAERRLNQRQTLTAVPVTEIHFTNSGKDSRFWVYGLDRKVHFPDYPAKCCWGCIVL